MEQVETQVEVIRIVPNELGNVEFTVQIDFLDGYVSRHVALIGTEFDVDELIRSIAAGEESITDFGNGRGTIKRRRRVVARWRTWHTELGFKISFCFRTDTGFRDLKADELEGLKFTIADPR